LDIKRIGIGGGRKGARVVGTETEGEKGINSGAKRGPRRDVDYSGLPISPFPGTSRGNLKGGAQIG